MRDNYVYLKLRAFGNKGSSAIDVDTIPLRATSVSVSTDKTVPNLPVPVLGNFTGEAPTYALDLGMSRKSISISGFITATTLKRSHYLDGSNNPIARVFTPQEIAQMISSNVDSTRFAKYQSMDELVILIPSYVDNDYSYRNLVNTVDPTLTDEADTPLIPLTFRARGDALEYDNTGVIAPSDFPTSENSDGVKGFVSQFSFDMASDSVEISFSMSFTVAQVF